ncbi:MAG: hypothetical protein CFE44_06325 [Burkholderiales bacterium PBB4]|nr:MAG: hypothetical protein CFE44_06325 [Burkholderiales bacterium PBB4]
MLGNVLSSAASAIRSPFTGAGAAVSGVRAVSPVVREAAGLGKLVPSAPRAGAAPEATRYTPAAPHRPGETLYNRLGGLQSPGYEAVSQSLSYARGDTFDLSIQTEEGDIATIHIAQQQSLEYSAASVDLKDASGRASAHAWSLESANALDVNIEVNGSLSAEETASIQNLVRKVQSVAEDFFAGDAEQAAAAAQQIRLGAEDSALSAYQFSLKSQEALQAVAVYESVANASTPAIAVSPSRPQSFPSSDAITKAPEPKQGLLESLKAMLKDMVQVGEVDTAQA